jgi:hypothetical protein
MSTRDRYALIAAIVLGAVAGALSAAAVFAAGLVFIAFSVVNPLIVSLMAKDRIMTLAQVPNLVALLLLIPIVLILLGNAFHGTLWRRRNVTRDTRRFSHGSRSRAVGVGSCKTDSSPESSTIVRPALSLPPRAGSIERSNQ